MTKIVLGDKNLRILGEREYDDNLWSSHSVSDDEYWTTSQDSPDDINGMSISANLQRETAVLILFSGQVDPEGISTGILNVNIDAAVYYPEVYSATIIAAGINRSGHVPIILSAGSHTIKLQLRSSVSGQTVAIYQRDLIVIELHK